MGDNILKIEAEHRLGQIFQDFTAAADASVSFPLTNLAACRAFSNSVTHNIRDIRRSDALLPPTALILAMIRLCHAMIDPPVAAFADKTRSTCVPRNFAYEIIDRLHAELPPTLDFALDQVGRIVNEAGDLANAHRLRRAFGAYRARQKGALLAADLDHMVSQVWHKRYPHHAELLHETFLSEAA